MDARLWDELQRRRLFELDRHGLAQRGVEYRITRVVGDIGKNDAADMRRRRFIWNAARFAMELQGDRPGNENRHERR